MDYFEIPLSCAQGPDDCWGRINSIKKTSAIVAGSKEEPTANFQNVLISPLHAYSILGFNSFPTMTGGTIRYAIIIKSGSISQRTELV